MLPLVARDEELRARQVREATEALRRRNGEEEEQEKARKKERQRMQAFIDQQQKQLEDMTKKLNDSEEARRLQDYFEAGSCSVPFRFPPRPPQPRSDTPRHWTLYSVKSTIWPFSPPYEKLNHLPKLWIEAPTSNAMT